MPDAATAAPASIAVIDVDGVVADVRHRLHHLRHRPPRWGRFFEAAGEDELLVTGARLVRDLARVHEIVWLSGRPEYLRELTREWLTGHGLPADRIELRAWADHRPAATVKLDRLRQLAQHATVAAAVDDDPDVIAAFTRAGFPAALADWVPREQILHRAQERDGRT